MKHNEDMTTLQCRVSVTDKEKISHRAEAAHLKMSAYLRTVALSDEKVIFLNEIGSIAKSLAEISTNLDSALRDKEIKSDLEEEMLRMFSLINDDFIEILDQISDIKLSDEGGE